MAKVTGPLFSLAASGTFGKVITFVCGHFAKKAESAEAGGGKGNLKMMIKFKAGTIKWKSLSNEIKKEWGEFGKMIMTSGKCISLEFYLTGFQLWMSYYLKFGENGWPAYPHPGTPPDLKI